MKIKALLAGLTIAVVPLVSVADPIQLKRLNIGMSTSELRSTAESNGYSCGQTQEVMKGVKVTPCQNEDATVTFYEKEGEVTLLSFDCGNFGVCAYDAREVAQSLVDNGIIGKLEYRRDDWNGMHFFGRGPDGDELVVKTNESGGVDVDLRKGSLGKSSPSFN